MIKVYHHRLNPRGEIIVSDADSMMVYDTFNKELSTCTPLLEFEIRLGIGQHIYPQEFVQAIIPDEDGNFHIFLALKHKFTGKIETKTLWLIPEMEEGVARILG